MSKPKKSKTIDGVIEKYNIFISTNFVDMSKEIFDHLNIIDDRFKVTNTKKKSSLTSSELLSEIIKIKEKISTKSKFGKSIYHIPEDVVEFMVNRSSMLMYGKDSTAEHDLEDFCLTKTFMDPVCKSGDFISYILKRKLEMLSTKSDICTYDNIMSTFATIYGSDIDPENILITKMRIILQMLPCIEKEQIDKLFDILNSNYIVCDFINNPTNTFENKSFDFIIGNPPFIENSKYIPGDRTDYGNVYANVLENSINKLTDISCIAFIIPISYVSTIRMKDIRSKMYESFYEQYIFSYADRPSSLIPSNHQKLCICISKRDTSKDVHHLMTTNYTIWNKSLREYLFHEYMITENVHMCKDYIPKLGTDMDISIYEKIAYERCPISELMTNGDAKIFVNNAASFWIKAFKFDHTSYGYKRYDCRSEDLSYLVLCLLNSSLFWWFWTCISDGWHITSKELRHFGIPNNYNPIVTKLLALNLERKLEQTKQYVGSKQIDYEYKHRMCEKEIEAIDEYINSLYGLTHDESEYIKQFKRFYRFSIENYNEDQIEKSD